MISIVIPARNEENNIKQTLEKLNSSLKLDCEIIVVNDHSTDKTKEVLLSLQERYKNLIAIDNMNEPGIASAINTGFEASAGEFVVCMMADLCDEIKTIELMHKKMLEGFDMVCGSRYMKGGRRLGGSKLKAFFSSFVGKSLKILTGIPTHDTPNAFKMYKKSLLSEVKTGSKGFEMSVELALKAYFAGYKISEVPTTWHERTEGQSHFKIAKLGPKYLKWYLWGIAKGIQKCFIR